MAEPTDADWGLADELTLRVLDRQDDDFLPHRSDIAQALADQRAAADGMHGPCGDQAPDLLPRPPVFCELRAGHDRWHENGCESWGDAEADDGLAEWECPSCGATTRARMADHDDGLRERVAEVAAFCDEAAANMAPGRQAVYADIVRRLRSALEPTPEPCRRSHDVTEDGVPAVWHCQASGDHDECVDSRGETW